MVRSIFDVWLIQLLPQWQSFFEDRKVCRHKTLSLLLAPQCSTPRLGRRLEGQRQVTDDTVLWFWPVIKATLHHRPDRRQQTICSETKLDASTNWMFHFNVPRSHFPFFYSVLPRVRPRRLTSVVGRQHVSYAAFGTCVAYECLGEALGGVYWCPTSPNQIPV